MTLGTGPVPAEERCLLCWPPLVVERVWRVHVQAMYDGNVRQEWRTRPVIDRGPGVSHRIAG